MNIVVCKGSALILSEHTITNWLRNKEKLVTCKVGQYTVNISLPNVQLSEAKEITAEVQVNKGETDNGHKGSRRGKKGNDIEIRETVSEQPADGTPEQSQPEVES